MAPDHPPPTWRPISALPALAAMIDGLHYSAEAVYQRLHRAHDHLRGLDGSTITRVRDVYHTHVQNLELDAAQLAGGRPPPRRPPSGRRSCGCAISSSSCGAC